MKRLVLACLIGAVMVVPGTAMADPIDDADGCTSVLLQRLVTSNNPQNPYPLVERDPSTGSITIHPQNAVPFVEWQIAQAGGSATNLADAVQDWVDCVV